MRCGDGDNVLGITVAEGWYRGRLGFHGGRRDTYGADIGPVAQLELHYDDGSSDTVVTDRQWRAAPDARIAASLYDGETYDARLADAAWTTAGFDDTGWAAVDELASVADRMVAPTGPPVRRIETLRPVAIEQSPTDVTVVDFGQNLTGRVRIRVRGAAGDEVTLRHAEVLDKGELAMWLLRDGRRHRHLRPRRRRRRGLRAGVHDPRVPLRRASRGKPRRSTPTRSKPSSVTPT